jgi:protein-L-isoaspartate(D-aspartate) O-methyltransferase
MTDNFQALRRRMLDEQVVARGITSAPVLQAMRTVPREIFIAPELQHRAYDDTPLSIGFDQTISQPFMVAEMLEAAAIQEGERALEVGAGSGYAAAVLSRIAGEVFAIERHKELALAAKDRLRSLGYHNVRVLHGDGSRGLAELAPFNVILVSAGASVVPRAMLEQLAIGGRIVIPVGPDGAQRLKRITRHAEDSYTEEDLCSVHFVPLVSD